MNPQTLVAVALACLASAVPLLGMCLWYMCRDRRHSHQAQADQRRWALQRQLWDLERQLWEESLPDWQREAIQESRQRQREITREARRRLGLPTAEDA
jgi:hypothetical protein